MTITHNNISSKALDYTVNGTNHKCTPDRALKPCFPQDEFDTVESCKVCKHFF